MKTIQFNNIVYHEVPKGKGYYYISEAGHILSLMRPNAPRILKPTVNGNGYYMVGFFTKPNRINVNIHRALMETFVPNPNNLPHINHIDGNKLNNSLKNLEWCTSKHNSKHAYDTKLSSSDHCERAVHQYRLSGEYVASFTSIHKAARTLDIHPSTICSAAQGNNATAGKYLWSYTKSSFITPYTGACIADYYLINNKKVTTLKEVCTTLQLSRASIHRRFIKFGNTFTESTFTVTRILCT